MGSSYSLGVENTANHEGRIDEQARRRRKVALKKTLIFFCKGVNHLHSSERLVLSFLTSNGTFSVDRGR